MENLFLSKFLMISSFTSLCFLLGLLVTIYAIYKLPKEKFSFSIRVLIGSIAGLILGLIIQAVAGFPNKPLNVTFVNEVTTWYSLLGNGYIDLIRMLVIPLVMSTIIYVIINMEQDVKLDLIVKRGLLISMSMVVISTLIGLVMAIAFDLGNIVSAEKLAIASESNNIRAFQNIVTTLRNLIPANPVDAMVDLNIVGLVIFAAFIGVASKRVSKKNEELIKPFFNLVNAWQKIIVSMVLSVIKWMPIAVVPLLANTVAKGGLDSILAVGEFIFVLYLAIAIMFAIQMLAVALFGLNPFVYVKKIFALMILAFTSRSSVGCLPVTISTLTDKLGVSSTTASFLASFGTTGAMQGCAGVFPAMAIVFVVNMSGGQIDLTLVLSTIIVVTIGSIGIAGIPGTATIAASVSLSGTGLAHLFPLVNPILAIDPIIDMPRTMLNVTGSVTNAIMTDKSLGNLDEKVYYEHQENEKTSQLDDI